MNITSEEYSKIVDSAPADHHSPEFVEFLRVKNVVVLETPDWLVIENIKYHNKDLPWYTAFDLKPENTLEYKLQMLQWEFPEYNTLIHSPFIRSVKRYHVHLLRCDKVYTL